MQSTAVKSKLIKKIKDERFDEDLLHEYALLLNFGVRDFQVGVVQSSSQRFLLLEDYVFPVLTSHEELLAILDQLFDDHPFLKAGFWQSITVGIKNQKFVHVPSALYDEGSLFDYLKFNAQIDPATEDFLSVHDPAGMVTVFAVQRDFHQWISGIYPSKKIGFTHQSTALIKGALDNAEGFPEKSLYIYIDRFKLHIIYLDKGKLVFYNQFIIKQFSDYVKYIMLVMKTLDLNQQTSQVNLWGYIGKNSPHYQEFYKYINNVSFGGRPKRLHFGFLFDEVQDHHFFDLFNLFQG